MGSGKIFFSYNRQDSEFALKLAQDLTARGIPIWIDQLNIPPGARWDSAVEKALEGSGSLLVVLSPASVASENVLDEVSHALANHKTVYPVIAEACRIPFRLGRFQHIDFTHDYQRALASLADAINASEPLPQPQPPIPPSPRPEPHPSPVTKPVVIGGAVVAVLIGLAFYLLTRGRGPDSSETAKRLTALASPPPAATTVESDHGPAAEASGKSAAPRVETAVKLHHRPAVAGTEKGVFFFAKDAWGRVHFNRAALGQSFEGWHDVADNALAVFPPAAATVGAYVYTVMAGTGGEVYLAQGGGNAFTPWSPMGFQTDDAPAVAGTTRHVYFFATHGDDVFYNWSVTNEGGKGWKRVDGDAHADSGPSAGAVRNHIFVAVRTGERKIAYNQADAEQAFNPTWASMDFKTDTAPAVAGAEDTIYFFARAPDGRVFYTSALLGQSFSDWRAMDDSIRAASAPAAGAVGGHLFIAVIGEDRKLHYNQGGVGSNFGRWDVMDLP